jgi:hypothetical protein
VADSFGEIAYPSNWVTVLLDYHANQEFPLENIPDSARVFLLV